MNSTKTPAFRPTTSCIWISFQSSCKRHLILTGGRGSGKSTLLSQLFPDCQPGLTSWAQPKEAVYLKDNLTGESVKVGVYDPALPGAENKMCLSGDGFNALGVPVLKTCINCDSQWITIDEIGYLEALSLPYQDALRELMDKKQVAAAVRKQDLDFLNEIKGRDDVFLVDLDNPFGSIGCVIMASGLGRRFGSNKLMTDFKGAPLINRIIEATEGIFSDRVVVTRSEEIVKICEGKKVPFLFHKFPEKSDTIRLGMEKMTENESCIFCTADQPLLTKETLAALALSSVNHKSSIIRPAFEETPGSPVIFPQWAFNELMSLPEGTSGSVIIKKYPEHQLTVSIRDKYQLFDIDTPEDLFNLAER